MNNIKQFLEADALRTQGGWSGGQMKTLESPTGSKNYVDAMGINIYERHTRDETDWRNAAFIAAASRIAPDIRAILAENERLNTLLSIREAAYDMDNKAGKEIERLTEQNAAMQAAFEQVCEALTQIEHNLACERYVREYASKALAVASPYRKGVV